MGGKETAKKAVTETIKQSAGSGTPPPYFLNLQKKLKYQVMTLQKKLQQRKDKKLQNTKTMN